MFSSFCLNSPAPTQIYTLSLHDALPISSVYLTGRAGTGKSTFLRYVCNHTHKKHIVLAPTGIAAINAGGVTLHSFFKIPFRPILPNDPDLSTQNRRIYDFLKYNSEKQKLI